MPKKCVICQEQPISKAYFNCKTCSDVACIEEFRKQSYQKQNAKVVNKKPIRKVSPKREALKDAYEKVRIEVLSEAKFKCFVENCNNVANTIEHQRGHQGFYDDWARDNNIPLHIDKRFLKPCCFKHNQEFENNPELSKKYQLSKIHKGSKL